jgi:hypothetical protein
MIIGPLLFAFVLGLGIGVWIAAPVVRARLKGEQKDG